MSSHITSIGDPPSQRPSNSAFKQQKLSAWQPILTVGTVLPTFFLIGVAFIPVGIGLLISSFQVREYEVDYTSCVRYDNAANNQSMLCSEYIARSENHNETCRCKINFTLETDFKRDVFLYYGLTNFYQNHRRYVKSRNDRQLLGQLRTGSDCEPYAYRVDPVDGQRKIIMPCGAIANSIFNDTFTLHFIPKEMKESQLLVPLIDTGIAWATDKKNKFRNPPIPEGATKLDSAFNNTMQPFNWRKPIYELDPLDINNNGLQNEGLIVWMRAAAFPTFRKLYARVAHDKQERGVDYQDSLPKGDYVLTIEYNFPVAEFKGRKRFLISNTSWLGGRNPFIGAVYIFVGVVALILSAIFLLIHRKYAHNSDTFNITPTTPFLSN